MPPVVETIAAVATAQGRGGVGIVRVSGPLASTLAQAICQRELQPRYAHYGPFFADAQQVLDEGLALYFPGPNSFTGEDVLELQGHGGPVVLDLLLRRCVQLGARLARPGEFSERAFLNDKLDLAQAEAIADLIEASSEQAARNALRSLQGEFSRRVHGLTERLISLRIYVEAAIDFPEEEIDFLADGHVLSLLDGVRADLAGVLREAGQGALLRDGMTVVIAGRPNAGKSSLLNALAGREAAIVTEIAGTTRDVLREHIHIDGMPLHVVDTAGLRDSPEVDEVERIGIERAWGRIRQADVVLFLHDLTRADDPAYRDADVAIAAGLPVGVPLLHVWNKLDQRPEAVVPPDALALSARQGSGLQALRERLLQLAGWERAGDGLFMARERHLQALHRVQDHLGMAGRWLDGSADALDLLAEELRLAQHALGEITGEFTADDLLGVIFSRFCIGK